MNMKEAVVSVLTNWNNFSGRACRSEFWYFVLATTLVSIIISIIEIATGMVDIQTAEMGILSIILTLLLVVPSLSVLTLQGLLPASIHLTNELLEAEVFWNL